MADYVTPDEIEKETKTEPTPKKLRVTVTISSLGNERRTIQLGEFNEEGAKGAVQSVAGAFNVIRASQALTLTDSQGVITFANLENVAFIEVNIT